MPLGEGFWRGRINIQSYITSVFPDFCVSVERDSMPVFREFKIRAFLLYHYGYSGKKRHAIQLPDINTDARNLRR